MSLLNTLILGLVRGIAGVLPISAEGLSAIAGNLMGIDINADPLFAALTSAGVLFAVILVWKKEILKTLKAILGMAADLGANLLILLSGSSVRYRRIITTSYRKIALLLLISLVPSAIISCLFGAYARTLYGNLLVSCIGMLLTSMILMVASFAGKQKNGPKEAGIHLALVTGALYGFSVFPGVSRIGTAAAGGIINELTPRFTATFAYLLFFINSVFLTLADIIDGAKVQAGTGPVGYILGTVISAAAGYFVLKRLRKRFNTSNSIIFAICGACGGIVLLIMYLI